MDRAALAIGALANHTLQKLPIKRQQRLKAFMRCYWKNYQGM